MAGNIRVAGADPGRFKDSFAFVLLEYVSQDNVIHILGAHGWTGTNYPEVESDISIIHKKKKIDFLVCEKNNTGIHVIESLQKQHDIPVIGITSSNQIKSPKIIRQGKTMDKTEMVGWINNKRQKDQILFPKNKTQGIMTLLAQLNSFVRKTTPAGLTTYRAEGEEHDDFVMAFMVALFFIRRAIIKDFGKYKRTMLSRKYEIEGDDLFGSGIPDGAILTGSTISSPEPLSTGKYKIR